MIRASSLASEAGVIGQVDPSSKLPDHSFLHWTFGLGFAFKSNTQTPLCSVRTRYDTRNIPSDFLADDGTRETLENAIFQLESGLKDQQSINKAYDEFCCKVKNAMNEKLNVKIIKLEHGVSNKRRKFKKPWWNEELSALWNDSCIKERIWLREKDHFTKIRLISDFIGTRKAFDRTVRKSKRNFKKMKDDDLIATQSSDQREFWKKIGSIGIANARQSLIPLKVENENGSVTTDIPVVLEKWKNDFSTLLNSDTNDTPDEQAHYQQTPTTMMDDVEINGDFTYAELQNVLKRAKNNKAPGFDEIPVDVLKNSTACSYLLRLFNICFSVGKIPKEWSKCVLNPIPKASNLNKCDPLSYRGIALVPASYKLFCGLINCQLTKWAEGNNILADEQNDFRAGRSTIDHISSLTNIIETRKLKRKQTFAAY